MRWCVSIGAVLVAGAMAGGDIAGIAAPNPGNQAGPQLSENLPSVDVELVLAVDVSGSVNNQRYALQMEGIARTFEDGEIQRSILAGEHRSVFVTLVEWSNRPMVAVPWALIASVEDARAFADRVRHAPRGDDQFTCMSVALQIIGDKVLPFVPAPAERTIERLAMRYAPTRDLPALDPTR